MTWLAGSGFDAARLDALTARVVSSTGATTTAINPATGEPLHPIPQSSVDDVRAAIARAREAQEAWARVPVADRAAVLLRFHDLVLDRQTDILDIIQAESGKARKHAFEEPADVAMTARYYAYAGPANLLPTRRAGMFPFLTQAREIRHPKGVVGVISPWNYPFTMAVSDALPALLAGNAIVAKAAGQTTLTALLAVELLVEAGLPEGLWQHVVGDGASIGGAIADGVDFVCFTGSTAVGRLIASRCGERLIGCSLELGGKNPLLVLDDADLDRAAEGAVRACFSNAGQLCISTERVYVVESVYDEFRRRFLDRVGALRIGLTGDFEPDLGSLIGAEQLATVRAHLDDAVDHGARVLTGGRHRPDIGPFVFEPTVLEDVRPGMRCFAEETFGPLVALYRVGDDEAAIAAANETSYGLSASVWSRDLRRAGAVAERLRTGTVNINEGYIPAWGSADAPMGGMRDSGLGRRHGTEGILKYTEAQTIAVQHVHGVAPIKGMSYGTFTKVVTAALRGLRKIGRA